jgi:8-oxo-dGTP pyrophosphatase MutT (NUDIX family)
VIRAYEVIEERRIGEGGFLAIRRLRLRLVREDGSKTDEGLYDFVERPMGLDAVVLALWSRRADGGVDVLVRDGLRVPLYFGRPQPPGPPPRFTELVAGILEKGEDSDAALRQRAVAEAHEEAGVTIAAASIALLGAGTFPTPGMCAEEFRLAACEVSAAARASMVPPPLDGSPFEEGAMLRWLDLDHAIAACVRGEITDMKTEVTLRRLRERLG